MAAVPSQARPSQSSGSSGTKVRASSNSTNSVVSDIVDVVPEQCGFMPGFISKPMSDRELLK